MYATSECWILAEKAKGDEEATYRDRSAGAKL